MRKKLFFVATCMMILAGCEKSPVLESSESELVTRETVPVNLMFFDVSTEDIASRADGESSDEESSDGESSLKTNNYFTRLDVSFFSTEINEVYEYHQTSDSDDFGKLSVSLPIGSYKLVAIAHKLDEPFEIKDMNSVSSPIEDNLSDLVYIYTSLEVGSEGTTSVCQMDRPVALFKLASTDTIPDDVYSVKVTFKSACSNTFSPTTSLAVNPGVCTLEKIPTHPGNGYTKGINFFTFVEQENQNVDIHVEILDKDGVVLNQFDFSNVYLEQKKRTTYKGVIFSPSSSGFSFESSITALSDIEDAVDTVYF